MDAESTNWPLEIHPKDPFLYKAGDKNVLNCLFEDNTKLEWICCKAAAL